MAKNVNIGGQYDSALERDLADVLTQLLSGASWLQQWSIAPGKATPEWDLAVSGPVPTGGKAVRCVECKSINFQPNQFLSLVDRPCLAGRASASARVLAMPRVSPRMASLC